jgi:hypothetical protein
MTPAIDKGAISNMQLTDGNCTQTFAFWVRRRRGECLPGDPNVGGISASLSHRGLHIGDGRILYLALHLLFSPYLRSSLSLICYLV